MFLFGKIIYKWLLNPQAPYTHPSGRSWDNISNEIFKYVRKLWIWKYLTETDKGEKIFSIKSTLGVRGGGRYIYNLWTDGKRKQTFMWMKKVIFVTGLYFDKKGTFFNKKKGRGGGCKHFNGEIFQTFFSSIVHKNGCVKALTKGTGILGGVKTMSNDRESMLINFSIALSFLF